MFKHATLNRSYRLIWSELHATWVAVAEFAGRRGKRSCGALVTGAVLALIAAAAAAAGDPAPNALPSGGQVVAGQVGIGASGARMDVTQSSGSAIVNWDSFNIGSHAHVNFVQPGSSSVMLNRVLGGEGSAIFGRMTANGNVFISNPGGILFAPGARVDVGGLVASSLGISDANFLAGKYHFERVGAGGTVANQGTINAANGGFVALIAPRVANGGSMTASGGSVGMAAGDSVNLDFDHDGLLSFQVNVATAAARADNSGVIVADGGRVVMDVRAKEALLSTVLNSDGIIRARSLESRNGEIWLGGGGSGVVSVTGTLDASGTGAGMHGGMVKVLGDKVGLFGQATIDVSGVGAGGTALVGGNWQGKGAERNASATYVGREVKIAANAIGRGDGGKVVAWADGDTRFYGSVSARGGALGGEGGKVEVSGKHRLAFAGKVDTRAPAGRTGMLLLDPDDIDINTGGADIATVGDGNAIVTFAESVDPGVSITPASLILLDTDVSLSANNDITFSSALSLNATRSLTAVAGRNITVDAAIDAPGGVDLTAGNSVAGTLTVAAGISSLGTIALKAGANPVLFDLTTAPVLTATITGGAGSDTVTGAGQTYTLDNATANAGSNGTVSWTSIENLTDSGAGIFQMGTAGSVAGTLTAVNGTVSYATRTAAASFALGGGASTGMGGWSGITTVAGSGNSDTVTGAGQTYTLDNATANAGSNGTVSWTSIENLTDSGAGIFQMGTAGSVGGTLTAVNGTVSYATRTAAASFALGGGASTGMGGWSGITTVAGSGNSDTVTGAGQTYTLDNATANAGSNGTVSWTSIENLTDSGAGIFQMGTAGSVGGTLTAVNGTVSYATRTAAASFALGGGASTGMGGWSGITTVAGSGNSDTVTGAGQTYTLDNATANAGSNGTVSWTSIENLTDSGAGIFQMGTAGSVAGTLTAVNGTVSYATRTAAASFALGGGASTGMGGWSGITTVAGSGNSDTVTGAGQTYTLDNATANAGSNGTVSWTSIENLTDSGAGIFQMGTAGSVAGTLTAVNGTVSYATRTAAASFALGGGASTGMGGWSGITTVAGSGNSDTVTGAGQTYTLDNATANAGSNGTVSWTSIENLTDSGAGIFQMGTAGSVAGTLTAVNGTVSYATRTAAASFALGGGASTGMGGWSGITTVAGSGNSDTVTGAGQTYTLDNATANAGSNGTVSWTSIENLTDSGAGIFQMGTAGSVGGTLTAVNGTVSYATRTAAASFALGGGASTGMGGWSGITTVAGSGNSDTVTGAGQTYTLDNATANAGSNGTVSWTSIENLTDSGAGIFQMGTAGSVGGTLTAVNGTVSYATRTAAASFALGGGASTGMGGWSGITTVAGSGNSDTVTGAGQTYTLDNATANAGSNGTVSWTSIENLTDSGAGIFQMGTAGSVGGTLTAVNGTVSYATRTAAASFALGGGASTGMGGWSGITTVAGSGNSDTVTGAGQTYTLDNATANAGSNGTVSWTSIENLTDSGAGIFQMGTAGSVGGTLTAVNGTVSYATRTAAASFALGGGASTGMGGWSGITTVAGSGNSDTVTGAGQTYTLDNATANAGSNGTVSWTSIENLTDSGAGIFQMGTAGSVGGTLTAVNGTVSYATRTAAASFALGGGASTGMGGWSGITTVAGSGNSDTVTGAGQTYTLDNATANAGSNGTVSWTSIENLTDSGAGIFQMGTAGSVAGTLTAVNGTVSYATRTAAASFALGGGASTGMGGWSGITTVAGSGNSDTVTGAGQTYTLDNATANAGSNGTVSWTSIENLTDSGAGIFQMGTAGSVAGTLTAVNGTVSYATRTAAASFALGGGASTGMGGWSGITTVAGSGNSDTVTGAGQTYTLDNATANAGSNGTVSWTSIENLTDSGAGIFQMGTAGSVAGTLTAVNGTVSYATRTAAASFALGGGASTGMGGWSGITTVAGSGNSDTVTGAGQTYTLDNATANAGSNGTVSWTSIENLTDSGAGIFQMGTAGSVAGTLTAVNGTVSYATRTAAASFALGGGASTGMGGWSGITTVAGSGNSDTVTGAGQTYTLDNATANAGSNGTVSWTSIENLTDSGAGIFQMGTAGSVGGTLTAVNGTVSYATRTAAASFALGGGASTGMGGWSGITTVAGSGNSDTVTGAGQTYTLDNATANAGSNGTVSWTSIENLTDSGAGIFQMGTAGSVAGTLTAVNGTVSYATRTAAASFALGGGASTGMGGWSGITTVAGSGNSDTVTGAGGTYNLTGVNSGSDGAVAWTSIENLTATGVSTLVFSGGSNLGGNLSVGAATIGGTVSTGGNQTYAGPVTLNSASTLTSSGGGSILFSGTVDGAQDLTVNTAGTTTFVGAVGGVVALTSLATDAAGTTAIGGGLVQTSGAQTYNDPVSGSAIFTVTGAGDISAANPGNSLGALSLNGVNAVVHNAGGITLGTLSLTGYLDLVAGGDIGQSGTLTAANLWASSSGSILLKNANVLGGAVSLIAGAGGEVWLNSDRIAVGTVRPSDGSTANVGISGERITLQAPNAAAFITTGVEGEVTASAPLSSIPALTIMANGVIGNAGAPTTQGLRVRTSGLVRVVGDGIGDGAIFLIGDDSIQPKYEFSGDPLHRTVKYNGADAANAQLTGALDAAYLDIRNQTTEIRESGFAKENASKVLRRGVVTSAGPGQPAVDDSTGMAGLESCDGNFGGSTLSCE